MKSITFADGQDLLGYLNVNLSVKQIVKILVPSFTHSMILGIDFFKLFQLEIDFNNLYCSLLHSSLLL